MDTVPAEGLFAASWLLVALPLAGAAVLLLGGRRTDKWGHLLGCATVIVAFVLGLLLTFDLASSESKAVSADLFTFISAGDLDVGQQHPLPLAGPVGERRPDLLRRRVHDHRLHRLGLLLEHIFLF